jgi:hypothetical protein
MEFGPEQLEEMLKEEIIVYNKGVLSYANEKDALSRGIFF